MSHEALVLFSFCNAYSALLSVLTRLKSCSARLTHPVLAMSSVGFGPLSGTGVLLSPIVTASGEVGSYGKLGRVVTGLWQKQAVLQLGAGL